MPFFERLKLKKIIYLAPDEPSPALLNFVEDQSITLIHLGLSESGGGPDNPWNPISEEVVISALKEIRNPDNYPLHVMCNLGRHRTGKTLIIAFTRC